MTLDKKTLLAFSLAVAALSSVVTLTFVVLFSSVFKEPVTVAPTPTPIITTTVIDSPTTTSTPTASTSVTPTPSRTPSPTPKTATIEVYMLNSQKYNNNERDYFNIVKRTTERQDVATYAVESIIEGPTYTEQTHSLTPTFGQDRHVKFTSNSNCSGKDFKLSVKDGAATVQFCRATQLAGDMSGGIVTQQIVKTLRKFSSISKVRVLNNNGGCFNDMSGMSANECYYR